MKISEDTLIVWVDEAVHEKWGIKAATRVLSILRTGHNAELKGTLKNKRPSQIQTQKTTRVPGMDGPVTDVFGVSQALTWMAGQRAEMQEDLEWLSHVPELIDLLLKIT